MLAGPLLSPFGDLTQFSYSFHLNVTFAVYRYHGSHKSDSRAMVVPRPGVGLLLQGVTDAEAKNLLTIDGRHLRLVFGMPDRILAGRQSS